MKIKNTTTGQIIELTYAPTGCDCFGDMCATDDNIKWSAAADCHLADQDTIDWWRTWLTGQEELDALFATIKEDMTSECVAEIEAELQRAQDCDMEDQPAAGKKAILDYLAENAYRIKTYDDGSMAVVAA